MNEEPTKAPKSESANERKRAEISELTGNDTTPGRYCEAKSFTGTNKLKAIPSTSPDKVILSGSNFVSASVKINPSSRNASVQYFNVENVIPNRSYQAKNKSPVRNSPTM